MKDKHDRITYSGRIRVDNLVIQSYTPAYSSKNKKGFEFSATLMKIKVGTAEYVEMGAVPLMSKQDSGKSVSADNRPSSNVSTVSTSAVKADGLKTTTPTVISNSAYSDYINTYNNKPVTGSGSANRTTPSYSGIR